MVQITDEHWKEIEHFFNNVYDEKLLVCPHCGMPYEEGMLCVNCGADNSEYEEEDHVTEWTI